jgi:hypothetical protein
MNQIVRDMTFYISPQGYHERTNMESQVMDYLVHDNLED